MPLFSLLPAPLSLPNLNHSSQLQFPPPLRHYFLSLLLLLLHILFTFSTHSASLQVFSGTPFCLPKPLPHLVPIGHHSNSSHFHWPSLGQLPSASIQPLLIFTPHLISHSSMPFSFHTTILITHSASYSSALTQPLLNFPDPPLKHLVLLPTIHSTNSSSPINVPLSWLIHPKKTFILFTY